VFLTTSSHNETAWGLPATSHLISTWYLGKKAKILENTIKLKKRNLIVFSSILASNTFKKNVTVKFPEARKPTKLERS
jgi:hypothetical protein